MFSWTVFFTCMARPRPAGLSRCRQDACNWRGRWRWIVSIALAGILPSLSTAVFAKAGVYSFVVPDKVTLLYVRLDGAGGGNGGDDDRTKPYDGSDDGGDGNAGGMGARVMGFLRVRPGDRLMVYVGSGGQQGASRVSWGNQAAGGNIPDGRNAGAGGRGGRPGKSGYSGGGGGGGAASYLLIQNSNVVALVTGGGGGGQGGAKGSDRSLRGDDASNRKYVFDRDACAYPKENGTDGADKSGDGGGGGGGGGGEHRGYGGSSHADNERGDQGFTAGAGYSCIDTSRFVQGVTSPADNGGGRDGDYNIQIAMPKLRLGVQTIGEIQGFTLTAGQNWNNGKGVTLSTSKIRQIQYSQWTSLNRYYEALEFSSSAPPDWQIGEARCRDTQAIRSGNSAAEIIARPIAAGRWQLDASYIKNGAEIECYITYTYEKFTLAGKLLADQDPASQQYQQPQAGVALSLDDCAGRQIASTVTDQNGLFSFIAQAVPQSAHCIRQHLPAGWLMRSVECRDSRSEFSENVGHRINATVLPSAVTQDWQLEQSRVRPGARWSCSVSNMYPGFHISGQILNDNGISGGTAHDGVANGGEAGRAGVMLALDNCAGRAYGAPVRSVANGWFSFNAESAQAGTVCLRQSLPTGLQAVSFNGGSANARYSKDDLGRDELRFELQAKTSYTGLLFGHVGTSLLSGSGQQQIAAGKSAVYSHIYTASTSASVRFDVPLSDQDKSVGWNLSALRDMNCNGVLDAADIGLDPGQTIAVLAGERVCILQRVQSPLQIAPAQRYVSQLLLTETITPQAGSGLAGIVRELRADNLTEISNAGESLKLSKQVRQVASCPSTAADGNDFGISNRALPGSYLEYLLSYRNVSDQPLRSLLISDAVPAYTLLRHAACDAVPAPGLAECKLIPAAGKDSEKLIQWQLVDTEDNGNEQHGLQPGMGGTVRYCVQIQQ